MKKYFCDKCGKELDFIEYIITPQIFDKLNRGYIAQQDYELCEKCFKKMLEE